jgi:hypothetical protein
MLINQWCPESTSAPERVSTLARGQQLSAVGQI